MPDSNPAAPLRADPAYAAETRWLAKTVHAARLLDDMEGEGPWTHLGHGAMAYTSERCHSGTRSLRLSFPSTSPVTVKKRHNLNPHPIHPEEDAAVLLSVDGEDWSAYNRISLWVYPHRPGYPAQTAYLCLRNEGAEEVPDIYRREGVHFVILEPDRWNQVVWEIGNLARDRVTGLYLAFHLHGHMPGWAKEGTLDFDQLELQQVDADHCEGWSVAPGRIAFSHVGYTTGLSKTACASDLEASDFSLIDTANGEAVFTAPVASVTTPLGRYQVLDFSAFDQPGCYRLRAGDRVSESFPIGSAVWLESARGILNFLGNERCGCSVPGIHPPCHGDMVCVHEDRSIIVNGGWHDAGDLSQMTMHTAPIVTALFTLANTVRDSHPALHRQIVDESRWGLDYLIKTRFGDGFRVSTRPTGKWTDGILGTADDLRYQARNMPYDNFVAASAGVAAWHCLRHEDPLGADHALSLAEEDWTFAVDALDELDVDIAGGGGQASLALFQATGKNRYRDQAIACAQVVIDSQERGRPDWDIPFSGFLYQDPSKTQILRYNPRSQMHLPFMTLAGLCEVLPDHPQWMDWYGAVARYATYLKAVAHYTEPYGMIPASIYALDEVHQPGLYSGQASLHGNARIEQEYPQYRAQVENGIRLADHWYLRRFPVWYGHRGNHACILSEGKAPCEAARLRGDPEARSLAQRQLAWILGCNPFAQSTQYGVGYDYPPFYSPSSGHMVGALTVGIQTRANEDSPYWPTAACYNYKEVWVEPLSRFLWIVSDLLAPLPDPMPESELRCNHERDGDTIIIRAQGPAAAACQCFGDNLRLLDSQPEDNGQCFRAELIDHNADWIAVLRTADGRHRECASLDSAP